MTKTILVTGGATGIGRTIARTFLGDGWSVVVHYNDSDSEAEELSGAGARTIRADLSTPEGCDQVIESYQQDHDNLDLLVNNAAVYPSVESTRFRTDDWETPMNLNARAPYHLATNLAEQCIGEGGSIVNITDASISRPSPDHLPYSASKAALANLTRGLARKLGPGIRVNAVAPGPIDFPENYPEEQRSAIVDGTVLDRTGSREEVAGAVRFLAENATYTTGTTIEVDGGQHLK